MVGGADDGRVVLDDHDGVPLIAQSMQDADEALGVAWVESDRRFVEDVEGVDERRTERRRQVDAFELAAGEGAGLAVEGQVLETNLDQVAQPALHLLEHQLGDGACLSPGERERREEVGGIADRHAVDVGDRAAVDAKVERVGADAGAAARRAGRVAAVAGEEDADVHLVGAPLEPAEPAADAGVVSLAVALDDEEALLWRESAPRGVDGNATPAAELEQLPTFPCGRLGAPGSDGPGRDRLARVGHHQVEIEVDHPPEAAAHLARAEGTVEREQVRHGVADRDATVGAFERRREPLDPSAVVGQDDGGAPPTVDERVLDRLDEPATIGRCAGGADPGPRRGCRRSAGCPPPRAGPSRRP